MRVGVSSCIVRELGGGPLSIDDVDIVELSAEAYRCSTGMGA